MQLSEILKTTRMKAFMTQEEFASRMGVTTSTINRREHGIVLPNMTAMKRIRKFCEEEQICSDVREAWV